MDRTRVVALGLLIGGVIGLVVAVASTGNGFDPFRSWAWLGASIGVSIRGWSTHRDRGPRVALPWAVGSFALMIGIALAGQAAGAALAPVLAGQGLPSLAVIAAAVVALATGAVLWERDPRVKRAIVLAFSSLAFVLGGLLSLVAATIAVMDGAWELPAFAGLSIGVALMIVSTRFSLNLRRTHRAEPAAAQRMRAEPLMDAVA